MAEGDKVFRVNYGVIFNRIGVFDTVYDHWTHTFQIPIPQEQPRPDYQEFCIPGHTRNRTRISLDGMCYQFHLAAQQLFSIKDDAVTYLNSTLKSLKHILSQHSNSRTPTRSSRSILPIVGQLSKTLFGIATEDDVQLLARHIYSIEKGREESKQAFTKYQQKLNSYMTTANQRITNIVAATTDNYKVLRALARKLTTFSNSASVSTKMSVAISHELQLVGRLRNNLEQFRSGVHDLLRHKISPYLIPIESIEATMRNISGILRKDHPDYSLQMRAPSQLYSQAKFFWTFHNNSIYINLKFPLVSKHHSLTLFKTDTVPLPVSQDSDHVSQLLDLPKYIGFSTDGMLYALPPTIEASACETNIHGSPCHIATPLIQRSEPCCASAIYHQDKNMVKNLCNFRFLRNGHTTQLRHLQHGQYLIANIKTIALACPKSQQVIKGCNICVMKFPCGCSIKAEKYYIPAHISLCNNGTSTSILHPVNLAVLLHNNEHVKWPAITGNTLLQGQLPDTRFDFNLFSHNVSEILANDKQQDLNLKSIIKAAKQSATVYESAADSILASGSVASFFNWTAPLSFLLYATTVVSVTSMVGLLWMIRKQRKTTAAIVLLTQQLQTHAFKIHIITSPTTSEPYTDAPFVVQTGNTGSHIMAAILIAIGVIILLKYLHHRHRGHGTLCIEFTSGKLCAMVPVVSLPMCPRFLHVQGTGGPSNFVIKYSLMPKLAICWNDIRITNVLTGEEIKLNDSVSVSWLTILKLKYMLAREHYNFLIFQHARYAYHVHVCLPDCTTCIVLSKPNATTLVNE